MRFAIRGRSKRKGSTKRTSGKQNLKPNPARALAREVEGDFVGEVGVPDEEILAHADIGPENGETEKVLTHVVVVVGGDPRER